jgi:hypothetical protein
MRPYDSAVPTVRLLSERPVHPGSFTLFRGALGVLPLLPPACLSLRCVLRVVFSCRGVFLRLRPLRHVWSRPVVVLLHPPTHWSCYCRGFAGDSVCIIGESVRQPKYRYDHRFVPVLSSCCSRLSAVHGVSLRFSPAPVRRTTC